MEPNLTYLADEVNVLDGCRNGNHQAQKQLYDAYAESMMILCLRYINNTEDARETLMDGFCSFFKNLPQFTYLGDGSVKAWLKKIMVNQCLMHLRKKKRLHISDKDIEQHEIINTQENIIARLSAKEIMKLIHTLPDGYRTVFNLYVFEGKNHKEIAEILLISESTSKTQLYKARLMLQKKLLKN